MNDSRQQSAKKNRPFIAYILAAVLAGSLGYIAYSNFVKPMPDAEYQSDAAALSFIGWGDEQQKLKSVYRGSGTTVAAMGYRDIARMTGCDTATTAATKRRKRVFSAADTELENCEVSIAGLMNAEESGNTTCVNLIDEVIEGWRADWDSGASDEPAYEFQDVTSADQGEPDGVVNRYDQVLTVQRLAGWPIGDALPGFANSRTVWNGDDAGWVPSENQSSCNVDWVQCFDRKEPLYAGIASLAELGETEGRCIVELHPDRMRQKALWGTHDVIGDIAPDARMVVASYSRNQEDSMSRAADWLIKNKTKFNIVAARTSNIMFLETSLLTDSLQQLCGDEAWCNVAGHVPYNESCAGDPYAGGLGYAHKSMNRLPRDYQPMAYQYERMLEAGIVPTKGTGHEGWKGALPYPDCSPALLSVGVVFIGTLQPSKDESLVEGGWASQGWRWHPGHYCEEKTISAGQVSCATNNSPSIGYGLADGSVVSPLMSPHPFESKWAALGNGWVTPFVVGAVAVLNSENLAQDISAAEVINALHLGGGTVRDERKCDQDPDTDEPDGWVRADFAFHELTLQPYTPRSGDNLSKRDIQLLEQPYGYGCTDPDSPDTAEFHTDNVPDYDNRLLNIGGAVEQILNRSDQ